MSFATFHPKWLNAWAGTFTTDETGYIGIHEEPDYTNMTSSDTVVNGCELFAERLDGIVVATITPGE